MSEAQKKAIHSFVKKNYEELKETCQQEDFAELLFEVYKTISPNDSNQKKVKYIRNQLNDGESIDASDFIEADVDKYLDRLVHFVDKTTRKSNRSRSRSRSKEDPLERNNLKNSSDSSDDDDKDRHQHRLQIKKRNDDSRQNRRNQDKKNNNNNDRRNKGQKQQMPNLQNAFQNFLRQMQKFGGGNLPSQFNLENFIQQLGKNPGNQRQERFDRNRKDTVFLINLPREFKTLNEISEIFKGKGEIANVNLGKFPSVQMKKIQEAQNLINNDNIIVHKGVKIELSATPNRNNQRRREREEVKVEEEGQEKQQQQQQTSIQQQQQQQQQQQLHQTELDEKKQERLNQKTLETLKSNLNTLIAEKLRTLLALSKRNYPQDLLDEIEEQKKNLKALRETAKNLNKIDAVKAEIAEIQDRYDYSLLVKSLPENLFQTKTVMKVLTDYFQQFGKIDTLAVKLKERAAVLKFLNFDSAEKAYLAPQQFNLEFINPSIVTYLQSKE